MKPFKLIALISACCALAMLGLLLLTSPLLHSPFQADDWAALLLWTFGAGAVAATAITWILACCKLDARLGYDLYAGLLLLIPVVNLVVFVAWAFRVSPREQELRRLKKRLANVDRW